MKRAVKIITGFWGLAMFMTGVVKFVSPFQSWYGEGYVLVSS